MDKISRGSLSKEQSSISNSSLETNKRGRRHNRDRSKGRTETKKSKDDRTVARSVSGRCSGDSGSINKDICSRDESNVSIDGFPLYSEILKSRDDDKTRQLDVYRGYDRIGTGNDEESVRPECTFLTNESNLFRTCQRIRYEFRKNKWNVGKWGPKPAGARGAQDHYAFWRNAYDSYLWEIFDRVNGVLNKFKDLRDCNLDFSEFAEFAYEFSSGYITPYT